MNRQNTLDQFIANRQFDDLSSYLQKEQDENANILNAMLEIWQLEREHGEGDIWAEVYDVRTAVEKYSDIAKLLELILSKQALPDQFIAYLHDKISVWAMLAYIFTTRNGIHVTKALVTVWVLNSEKNILSDSGRQVLASYIREIIIGGMKSRDFLAAEKLLGLCGPGILEAEEERKILRRAAAFRRIAERRLYTPTMLAVVDHTYFIVDCWHGRVLYSTDVSLPIEEWKTLDDDLKHPHSVSGKGGWLLSENTEKGTVCIYQRTGEEYTKINETEYLGKRPHKIIWDDRRAVYWVLCSGSWEIVALSVEDSGYQIKYRQKMPEFVNIYCRGFSLLDDILYIISSKGKIVGYQWEKDVWKPVQEYMVPEQYYGMNDMMYLREKYYISVYQNDKAVIQPALLQADTLQDLESGKCVDLYEACQMQGVPYFFSLLDGKVCIPEIDISSRIVLYDFSLKPVETLFDFGRPLWEDKNYDNASMLSMVLE